MSATLDAKAEFLRDDKGRAILSDGYPAAGLATIDEVVSISGLSRSKVYSMLDREIPTRRFGRSRRVEWAAVRRMFLSTQADDSDQ